MKKNRLPRIIVNIMLTLTALSFLFPLVWMLELSFKDKLEVYDNPFLLPKVWDFNNYYEALTSFNIPRYFTNSVVYTASTVLVTIIFASMFAYATSRMRWKFSSIAMVYITLGLVVPIPVVILPIYLILRFFGLMSTYFALIFPYVAVALPVAALMLFAFFRTLPKELEQSAYIDGCGIYGAFIRIIFPIIKPAIAAQIIFIFMNTWNEYFIAFILTSKDLLRSLTIGLANFFVSFGVADWGVIGAGMVIVSIPVIIIYLLFSEQIENALTAGAILK